jgi:hypothetical protein
VNRIAFVLRDHREALWRRWVEELERVAGDDYRELMSSPIGERSLRVFIDDLIAYVEAEEYESAGALRRAAEHQQAEAAHRVAVGFSAAEVVGGLHALRAAAVDVLGDALAQGDLPPFGETLDQLKVLNAFIDRLTIAAGAAG